jgi:hypothetical protein
MMSSLQARLNVINNNKYFQAFSVVVIILAALKAGFCNPQASGVITTRTCGNKRIIKEIRFSLVTFF